MNNNLEVNFEFEKDTKNTIRFKEVLNGPLDAPSIGTLYVPKQSLKAIGYKEGQQLVVTLSAK